MIRTSYGDYDETPLGVEFSLTFNGEIWERVENDWGEIQHVTKNVEEGETYTYGFIGLNGYEVSKVVVMGGQWNDEMVDVTDDFIKDGSHLYVEEIAGSNTRWLEFEEIETVKSVEEVEHITIRNMFERYSTGLNSKYEILFNGDLWEFTLDEYDGVNFVNHEMEQGETFSIGFKSLDGYEISDILAPFNVWGEVKSDLENWNFNGEYYERIYTVEPTNKLRMDILSGYKIETVIEETPKVSQFPFIKIYNIDEENLEKLSLMNVEPENDVSQYIMGLYRIPYNVDGVENTNVLLGDTLTDVEATSIDKHIYTINFGDIHISKQIWGGVSFSNVFIELYVPYFNKITLDTDEVVDNTLHLDLNLNLLNGTGTLNVRSKNTWYLIHSENKQIGQYIPYILGDTVKSEMGTDVLENDIINPYVEIKKHIPDNSKELRRLQALKLKDSLYLIQTENLILNSNANSKEKREIERLMKGGVIVRGNLNMENVEINTSNPSSSDDREQDFWDDWGDHGSVIGG